MMADAKGLAGLISPGASSITQLADARQRGGRRLEADGTEPVASTPQAFAAFIRKDIQRWASVIRYSGAKPE